MKLIAPKAKRFGYLLIPQSLAMGVYSGLKWFYFPNYIKPSIVEKANVCLG